MEVQVLFAACSLAFHHTVEGAERKFRVFFCLQLPNRIFLIRAVSAWAIILSMRH